MVLYALVMEMEQVISTALLKVKCINQSVNPESLPFDEYISSSKTSIKIDFPNGKSLMEREFRRINSSIDKFYLEFFEEYDPDNFMSYLMNKDSNYRATSLDGTIIRLAHNDYDNNIKSNDTEVEDLEEFVFVEEKESFFQKIKRIIHKKDN